MAHDHSGFSLCHRVITGTVQRPASAGTIRLQVPQCDAAAHSDASPGHAVDEGAHEKADLVRAMPVQHSITGTRSLPSGPVFVEMPAARRRHGLRRRQPASQFMGRRRLYDRHRAASMRRRTNTPPASSPAPRRASSGATGKTASPTTRPSTTAPSASSNRRLDTRLLRPFAGRISWTTQGGDASRSNNPLAHWRVPCSGAHLPQCVVGPCGRRACAHLSAVGPVWLTGGGRWPSSGTRGRPPVQPCPAGTRLMREDVVVARPLGLPPMRSGPKRRLCGGRYSGVLGPPVQHEGEHRDDG
jgi:hypothetical protein